MPVEAPLQKSSVVGEDGELIQPDTTIDPDSYAEYVQTYVHRDPLLFRMREHVKAWSYAYAFFISIALCGIITFFSIFTSVTVSSGDKLLFIGVLVLAVGLGYWILHHDTRS